MKSRKLLYQTFGMMLAVLLLAGCGRTSSAPIPGKWTGTAEFGTLVFTVNPQSRGVTYVEYTFSNCRCGGTTQSGTIGNGQETGWDGDPIVNGQFTFDGSTMTLKGTFDASGTSASGTWTYPECGSSGTWTASAVSQSTPIAESTSEPKKTNTPAPTATPAPTSAPIAASIIIPYCDKAREQGLISSNTYLCMVSEPGDFVGAGKNWILTSKGATFSTMFWYDDGGGGSIAIEGDASWHLAFQAPHKTVLIPGVYEHAIRVTSALYTNNNGLDVGGHGRGCNEITGRFEILEIVCGDDNDPKSFAANFEQHCEGESPALFGYIRFNSAIGP